MTDLISKINIRLNEAKRECQENKAFINDLALKSKLGPDENKVADFIVDRICERGNNREAIIMLLDEFASIDSKIKDLNYRRGSITIEREKKIYDGRPDIVITIDGEDKIFIENKILATDQKGQIKRYKDAAPTSLIYLTRFGHKASDNSESGLKVGKDYYLASYYKHIYNWICKLKEKQQTDDINNFFIWLKCQIYGMPDVYELILNNKSEVMSDISVVKQCGDGFRQYVMWHHIIPVLQEFAEGYNLFFEVSDRFEFKVNNSYIRFNAPEDKEIKIMCGVRKNNSWSGMNVKGTPITLQNWDFEQLLYFENIIDAITQKVKEEISIN